MPIEWAGLGPELLVQLDRSRPEPIRVQLESSLRQAIRSGRLAAGERLPSSRELAKQLGVSRGVVPECYEQVYAEGHVSARAGSATRVAEVNPSTSATPRPVPRGPAKPRIDFASGVPDLAGFPRADWVWALYWSRIAPLAVTWTYVRPLVRDDRRRRWAWDDLGSCRWV